MSALPSTWLETHLGAVVPYGATVKAEPSDLKPDTWVLELEDIEKDTTKVVQRLTFAERQSKSTKNRFDAGDVLYGKLRPYLNKVTFADQPGVCTTEIVPIKPTEAVSGRYLFHWLRHPKFLSYVTEVSHGVNMPRLGTEAGRQAPFVLAPKSEQKRIADKLDTVLTRVDAVNTRLARVAPLLKRFRQSVLESITRSSEPEQEMRDLLHTIRTGPFGSALHKSDYVQGGIPVVNPMHIIDGDIRPSVNMTVTVETAARLSEFRLVAGDVVIGRRGEMGRCAVVKEAQTGWLCGTGSMILRPKADVSPHFLQLVLSRPSSVRTLEGDSVGSTMVNLNQGILLALRVSRPNLEEQTEIVRRVDTLFAFADRLEARLHTAQTAAHRLTPALLAKAFRGELVPQDPNDEPASELLKRLAASATVNAEKRGRTKVPRAA